MDILCYALEKCILYYCYLYLCILWLYIAEECSVLYMVYTIYILTWKIFTLLWKESISVIDNRLFTTNTIYDTNKKYWTDFIGKRMWHNFKDMCACVRVCRVLNEENWFSSFRSDQSKTFKIFYKFSWINRKL